MPAPDWRSPYEQQRWDELQEHWARLGQRREAVAPRMRAALGGAAGRASDVGARAAGRVAQVAPGPVKRAAGFVLDSALAPTAESLLRLLRVVTDWSVELTDADRVLSHHRGRGRNVTSLEDLRHLELSELDEVTRRFSLRWSTLGAAEGGALGALAFVPVAGGLAAITLDVLVVHVLSTSIATRAMHAYGFDPSTPEAGRMIEQMVNRAYKEQASKITTQRQATSAFTAATGRRNWSAKLREDHRILEVVEKLMKQAGSGGRVPVARVAKALPVISVVMGAGTNAHLLGTVAKHGVRHSQTVLLSQRYGLPLPSNLRTGHDGEE
jgi:hypothetical protein